MIIETTEKMMIMQLYSTPLSGHGHRVEQFLRFLDLPFEYIEAQANFRASSDFLQLNPLGQIPVLVDGELVLTDSCAILVYLAKTYAPNSHWLPEQALEATQIQRWLAIAAGELKYGCAFARMIQLWNVNFDLAQAQQIAHRILTFMNDHLAQRKWLATEQVTIADIACYAYVALAPEGGVSLEHYSNIQRWITDFEALPKFKAMPSSVLPCK